MISVTYFFTFVIAALPPSLHWTETTLLHSLHPRMVIVATNLGIPVKFIIDS
jgi:hypothetical protein